MALIFFVINIGIFIATSTHAAVHVPSIFSDYMVLQRNIHYGALSQIYGWADTTGEKVRIVVEPQIPGKGVSIKYHGVADTDGKWSVTISPMDVSIEWKVTVFSDSDAVYKYTTHVVAVAQHVRFGDVFFCSGESNMVFPVKLTNNATTVISEADDPAWRNFRLFTVPTSHASSPQNNTKSGEWLMLSSKTVADFSAICYLTARNVARLYINDAAVGLILSAVNESRIEAWISFKALATCEQKGFSIPIAGGINERSALWNAMIEPLQYYSVRAVLWYQGEKNAKQEENGSKIAYYKCMLETLIADWRGRKRIGDFPFMVIQLPPSRPPNAQPTLRTGFTEIRIAQDMMRPLAFGPVDISGVAVTLDLGGFSAWGWDHPINKNEMAWRLALNFVNVGYAQQGRLKTMFGPGPYRESLWTGPIVSNITRDRSNINAVIVDFLTFSSNGLELRDVYNCTLCCHESTPFQISYDHGASYSDAIASTVLPTGRLNITGRSHSTAVTHVRYAWSDFVQCVLVNSDDLPLGPFVREIKMAMPTEPDAISSFYVSIPSLKPPIGGILGWNSWNAYHCNIDENEIRAIANVIVDRGLKAAGYEYINIDDCWQVGRNSDGTIIVDPTRFPSGMKAVASYVHSKGLKFGVYTASGSKTCQDRPGAYGYELHDAATYCEWGVDYLKNDNCGGTSYPNVNASWSLFRKGFDDCFAKTGRYIVTSVEYCRDPDTCGRWISNFANLWRTTGDIQATWNSVLSNIWKNDKMRNISRPGHLNDPDMLEVGASGLTYNEQKSHFSLWCIVGAPLLASTDLIHASEETISILTAKEPIAVNRDPGLNNRVQGYKVHRVGATEVWAKPLHNGKAVAVILLNLDNIVAHNVTVQWCDIGVPVNATASVRDSWSEKYVNSYTKAYTALVDSHDVHMITINW